MNIKVFPLRNSNKKVFRLPSTSSQISCSLGIYTESRKKTLHIFTYFERLFSSMTHLKNEHAVSFHSPDMLRDTF